MKKWIIIAVVLILVSASGWYGYQKYRKALKTNEKVIQTAVAEIRNIQETIETTIPPLALPSSFVTIIPVNPIAE